jgi:hypothetical protein
MLRALWEWLWKARDRRWSNAEIQERVLTLELEWGEVLDKILAREDRERKRRLKALKDDQAAEAPQGELPLAGTKDDLRQRVRALRGIK